MTARLVDLRSNGAIVRLGLAALFSQLGDWSARLALGFLLLEETGLASAVGVVGALFFLPYLGPGQWLASFGDRMDRVRLLVGCEVARAFLFVVLALLAGRVSVAVLLAAVALVAVVDPVWESNRSALIVEVSSKEEYPNAVKALSTVNQTALLVGYGLGGILVASLGVPAALAVNAATFVVSGVLVSTISSDRPQTSDGPAKHGSLEATKEFLANDRTAAVALLGTLAIVIPAMAIETQAPVYGEAINLSKSAIGVMAAFLPAGTIVASLAFRTGGPPRRLLAGSFALSAAAALVAAALINRSESAATAWLAYALIGVVFASSTIANIVVGRRIGPDQRAAVFAVIQGSVLVAFSIGALLGGILADLIGSQSANAAMAIACAVFAGSAGFVAFRTLQDDSMGEIT